MPYNPNVDLVVGIFLIMAPLLIVGWLVLAVILVGKPSPEKPGSHPAQKPPPSNQPCDSSSPPCSLLDALVHFENDLSRWSSNGDPEIAQIAREMLQSCLAARSRLAENPTSHSRVQPEVSAEDSRDG